MKLKLFLLCHLLNAEKFEFYYTSQDTEFGNGIFSFHSISLQFSAPENPSVHPVNLASNKSHLNVLVLNQGLHAHEGVSSLCVEMV